MQVFVWEEISGSERDGDTEGRARREQMLWDVGAWREGPGCAGWARAKSTGTYRLPLPRWLRAAPHARCPSTLGSLPRHPVAPTDNYTDSGACGARRAHDTRADVCVLLDMP